MGMSKYVQVEIKLHHMQRYEVNSYCVNSSSGLQALHACAVSHRPRCGHFWRTAQSSSRLTAAFS